MTLLAPHSLSSGAPHPRGSLCLRDDGAPLTGARSRAHRAWPGHQAGAPISPPVTHGRRVGRGLGTPRARLCGPGGLRVDCRGVPRTRSRGAAARRHPTRTSHGPHEAWPPSRAQQTGPDGLDGSPARGAPIPRGGLGAGARRVPSGLPTAHTGRTSTPPQGPRTPPRVAPLPAPRARSLVSRCEFLQQPFHSERRHFQKGQDTRVQGATGKPPAGSLLGACSSDG